MTEFALWAPGAIRVRLRLRDQPDREMAPAECDWWRLAVPDVGPGTDYTFLLDDAERPLPDPRSRWQPHGIAGPSRVYDHGAFDWTDQTWTGRELPGSILYQLHVARFTADGTFGAALERLDHLVDLGVDLIELLPVNASDGSDSGGYPISWYAPQQAYGGPDGLKRLVDAAHGRGLGVVLDVAYHDARLAGAYAPHLGDGGSAWVRPVELHGEHADQVRRALVDSVLMWLGDYHADGLRLDVGHATTDHGTSPLLDELTAEVDQVAARLGRPLSLIAESDLTDFRPIRPRDSGDIGPPARYGDDARHAPYALLTGEARGYRPDFGPLRCLSDVLTGALVRSGVWSSFRDHGNGQPADRQRGADHRSVAYPGRPDRIGNRSLGDGLPPALSPGLWRVGATLLLTAPITPLLLMGEEWGAGTRWQRVASQPEPELATVAVNGRHPELAAPGGPDGDVPEPHGFPPAGLDWAELDKPEHREILDFYRRLITLRKSRPDLSDPNLERLDVRYGDQFVVVRRGRCFVAANLAGKAQRITLPDVVRAVLLATRDGVIVMRDGVELPAESAAVVAA